MKIRQTPLPRTAALAALAWLLTLSPLHTSGQVPSMISYQGRIVSDSVAVNGNGEFKFALVRGAGPTLLWKNDGSAGNTEPAVGVTLPVSEGLIMTLLGDTPMSPIPPTVFTNNDVRLRVWFREGANFQLLSPDQRIVSVGYAMMAGNVPDGSITAAKLAPGAVNPANFPPNSVGSPQVTDSLSLGAQGT
ncbi:MAG: hypothetical protein FJ405_19685, partial [Verrucomicrobia bacterium]|nr:hypothetical protein [Verrucomicrobiota bacterium]